MLTNLLIEGTKSSPKVKLYTTGELLFEGKSMPDNGIIFFKPILDWVEDYTSQVSPKTVLTLNLDYINTISHKIIIDIVRIFDEYYQKGNHFELNWYYDLDDLDLSYDLEDVPAEEYETKKMDLLKEYLFSTFFMSVIHPEFPINFVEKE